jgi:hypothetical protein
MQPQGLECGYHRGILSRNRGGFCPAVSPPNPTMARTIAYEYLFYLLSSDQLRQSAQRKARGLLLGSSTPGTVGHRL